MRQLLFLCVFSAMAFPQSGANLGIFSKSGDIGDPAIRGSATYSDGRFRITGAGSNIWGKQDQFQYVWREITGNFTVSATIQFLGKGADHRKAGIMVRQSADPDSAYADLMIHGNGMPGLQWRSRAGEETNTFDTPFEGPGTFKVKFVRNGVKMYMFVARNDGEPKEIAHTEVSLQNPVLVGLAVCSHNAEASDTVEFSDVVVETQPSPASKKQ